jgi:ribosomal protein S11
MFLKTIINKKKILNNFSYLKKKKLIIYLIILFKILKRNCYLTKYINFAKFTNFIEKILKFNHSYNLFYYKINSIKNYKLYDNFFSSSNLISYIIKITLLKSNIFINITNIKGIPLIACSSGLIDFKGSQKTKRLAYNRIIKFTKFKIRKLKSKVFAIHFKGRKYKRKKLLKTFKKFFKIKNIKYFNLIAHNGCRLKK